MMQRLRLGIRETVHSALDWFYPPHCYHCEAPLSGTGSRILCSRCAAQLADDRIRSPMCPVCGRPYETDRPRDQVCVPCWTRPPHFDRARALFAYWGPAASLVKSFKFHGDFFVGPLLVQRAIELDWLPDDVRGFDCVVPVPLHRRRERERGYNQAALLGEVIAGFGRVPRRARALRRRRYTDQQTRLSAVARRRNVHGAFEPGADRVEGEHVLLVDDVLTTGATANECARVLRQAGAAAVTVFVLVRAQP